MTIDELKGALDERGVDPNRYSLTSSAADDLCVLERFNGGWASFYSERGQRFEERWFATETEACEYFLAWITTE